MIWEGPRWWIQRRHGTQQEELWRKLLWKEASMNLFLIWIQFLFSFRFGSPFERIFFSKHVILLVSLLVCCLNVFYTWNTRMCEGMVIGFLETSWLVSFFDSTDPAIEPTSPANVAIPWPDQRHASNVSKLVDYANHEQDLEKLNWNREYNQSSVQFVSICCMSDSKQVRVYVYESIIIYHIYKSSWVWRVPFLNSFKQSSNLLSRTTIHEETWRIVIIARINKPWVHFICNLHRFLSKENTTV